MSVYVKDNLEFLEDSVNSILNQTLPCNLYILADGEISHEMSNYLEDVQKNNASSVIFIKRDINKGLATTLNELIDYIIKSPNDFKYIARMDSDDISYPNRIESQVRYLEEHLDIDVCGTSCREFGADFAKKVKSLPEEHDDLLTLSITKCPFIHPSVLFRTTVFESEIRYPTNTAFTEDMALWFLLLNYGYKFANLNEVLIDYRLNENTIRRRLGWDKGRSEFMLRIKYMFILRKISISNIILVFSRLFFHILPEKLVTYMYKKHR